MSEKKFKGLSNFGKILIGEIVVLIIILFVCRMFVFPELAKGMDMMHIQIATHTFVIGICATVFSVVAILVKRKMKTHKKYIILPVIFTLFGFLMQVFAEEITILF